MANERGKRRYKTGAEVVFQHAGILVGRVERMLFDGERVRYEVSAVLTFDVPEPEIVGGMAEIIGTADEACNG